MKLLKKLLPLSSLATVAVAAPIVVSCSKLSAYSWTFIGEEAEEPEYHTQPIGGKMNEAEAENNYFDNIIKNPEILADDVICHFYHSEYINNKSDDLATTVTITVGKIDKIKKTISYQIAIKGQKTIGITTIPYEEKVICENMPFEVKYNDETKWSLIHAAFQGEILKNDKNWSLSVYDSYPFKESLIKLNYKNIDPMPPDEDVVKAFSKIGITDIRYLSTTEKIK